MRLKSFKSIIVLILGIIGVIVLIRFGRAESKDGVPVYVSKGVGTFSSIPRVFARPQVIFITLTD